MKIEFIKIDKPCLENWENMKPNDSGKEKARKHQMGGILCD